MEGRRMGGTKPSGNTVERGDAADECLLDPTFVRRLLGRLSAPLRIIHADAPECPRGDASADAMFSTFGLKTFHGEQLAGSPPRSTACFDPAGGHVSELSMPWGTLPLSTPFRWASPFYSPGVIPIIGRFMRGNPKHDRLLRIDTRLFGHGDDDAKRFRSVGFRVPRAFHFFGHATSIASDRSTQ